MGGITEAQLQKAIEGAVKEVLISHTVATKDHSTDISEIKSDVKLIKQSLGAGDKHFERIDGCLEQLTKLSQKQETDISLIKQTQNTCKENKKSFVAVLLSGIAVVGSIAGIVLQHLLKK